jgi:diketogulonate reductase-like aldo/keto reductase
VWHHMERLYRHELTRAIGVSNYGVAELEALKDAKIMPMVNQVKCSPFEFNKPLYEYCRTHGVVFESYSPLTRGTKLADPTITAIATRHERTPAQILLRWNIEHGMVTIPKSATDERLLENASIFDFQLTPLDMTALDTLSA